MKKQLHVISSGQQSVDELTTIIQKIHPLIDYIHLREHKWTVKDFLITIDRFLKDGVPAEKIVINDRIDVAYTANLQYVQLPHHSFSVQQVKKYFPALKMGRSVQNVKDAMEAEKWGASWLIHGHIYPTASKKGIPPRGLSSLRQITQHVNLPVIAIGGITPERTMEVLQAGAAGVAVLSSILFAKDPFKMAQKFRNALATH